MFGKFQCPECSNEWASASAWEGYEQGCKQCDGKAEAFDLRRLKPKRDGSEGEDKRHLQELCDKCQELSYNCTMKNQHD